MTAKTRKRGKAETEALVEELRHLRTLAKEAAESFILRREGEIETAIACLGGLRASVVRRRSDEWTGLLAGLKLKPEKGRLKDLKEIHEVVRKLVGDLLEESEVKPRKKKPVAVKAAREKRRPVMIPEVRDLMRGSAGRIFLDGEGPPSFPPTL